MTSKKTQSRFHIIDTNGKSILEKVRRQYVEKGVVGLSVNRAVMYHEDNAVRAILGGYINERNGGIVCDIELRYYNSKKRHSLELSVCGENNPFWVSKHRKTDFGHAPIVTQIIREPDSGERSPSLFAFNYPDNPFVVFLDNEYHTSYQSFGMSGVHPVSTEIRGVKCYTEEKRFLSKEFAEKVLGIDDAKVFVEPYGWNRRSPTDMISSFAIAQFDPSSVLDKQSTLKQRLDNLRAVNWSHHSGSGLHYLRAIIAQLYFKDNYPATESIQGYARNDTVICNKNSPAY